jgi:hypothetical protein
MGKPKLATVDFLDFSGGVNWRMNSQMLPENQFRLGVNLTQNEIGKPEKRGGRMKLNAVAAAAAIHSQYRFARGATSELVVGTGTLLQKNTAGVLSNIQTGMSGTPIEFVPWQGYLWMADGTNMFKYNQTAVQNWGIAAPTVAPTYTYGAPGSGTFRAVVGFKYMYTYYNSTSGHETYGVEGASTGAFGVEPGTEIDHVHIALTASTDPQVDKIRIYRTLDGGADPFYRVATVANATGNTNYDNTDDLTLETQAEYTTSDHDPPTACFYICKHKERMFAAHNATYPSRLFWSSLNEPEAWPTTYYEDRDQGDGGKIRGICSFGDVLLIFKDLGITAVYGCENEDSSNWSWVKIVEDRGLLAPRTLTVSKGYVYWMADDKFIYRMSSDYVPQRISLAVDSKFELPTRAVLDDSIGINRGAGKLYFSMPVESTSTGNDYVLEFDEQSGAWFPYMNSGWTSMSVWANPNDNNEFYSGDSRGYIRQEEYSTTDDGVEFGMQLRSRFSHCGIPMRRKKAWELSASVEMTGETSLMHVYVTTEDGLTSPHTIGYTTGSRWIGGWIGGWGAGGLSEVNQEFIAQGIVGRYFAVDFVGSFDGDALVNGATIEYSVEN